MTETYVETKPAHRWRDPRPVWRVLALFFGLATIVYLLFALYGALVVLQAQYWLPPELAVALDSSFLALNKVATPLFLMCAALTLVLTYILIANAHTLESGVNLTSPAMAIASYFIPIICLFMPPAMMGHLWRATFASSGRQPQGIIALWWGAFLISSLIATWAGIAGNAESALETTQLFGWQTLGFTARMIAAITLLYIFGSIVGQQMLHQKSHAVAT